jgi:hypothetical protein
MFVFLLISGCLIIGGWIWARNGAYGFNVLLRRGGTYWLSMNANDSRLSPAMRESLKTPPVHPEPGELRWSLAAPGFDVAELPVLVQGREVDRIALNRIDPSLYHFSVRNAPNGDIGIREWEQRLPKSILIVNGSYFGLKGLPDTPVVIAGTRAGPTTYKARGGAFVANSSGAHVISLADGKWRSATASAANAMVSYPLLVGEDGQTHVPIKSRWLANRTFVGETRRGQIIIGTTRDAFFNLASLAEFLRSAPLDLRAALNLDGGPIACQSVRLGPYHRIVYAKWEAQTSGDKVRLLRWPFDKATWAMPMVLTVEPR